MTPSPCPAGSRSGCRNPRNNANINPGGPQGPPSPERNQPYDLRIIDHQSALRRPPPADRHPPARSRAREQPVYARLPRAPITGSPVPHLTSLYHFSAGSGPLWPADWPGNCGGQLINDLLRFFRPATVLDPMAGSGTAAMCAASLASRAPLGDIHQGFDACDPKRLPLRRDLRFHLGTSAVLADEALRRRSPRPVALPRRWRISSPATASLSATAAGGTDARRQAGHPHGRLQRPRSSARCRWSTTPSGWPSPPGCGSIAPTSSAFHTATAAARKSTARSFIPGLHDVCMIFER